MSNAKTVLTFFVPVTATYAAKEGIGMTTIFKLKEVDVEVREEVTSTQQKASRNQTVRQAVLLGMMDSRTLGTATNITVGLPLTSSTLPAYLAARATA
tara:strand:+ start:6245 stop:6538 length:294 start_codon:yes stop_codon:yes gene_type:complete